MLLNPEDNKDYLPEDYICDILDVLPEKQKARFRDGQWVKAEGVIYDRFDETMIVKVAAIPERFDRYAAGQDFGLNITFVKIGWLVLPGADTSTETMAGIRHEAVCLDSSIEKVSLGTGYNTQ
jgi:hypothetical protein